MKTYSIVPKPKETVSGKDSEVATTSQFLTGKV